MILKLYKIQIFRNICKIIKFLSTTILNSSITPRCLNQNTLHSLLSSAIKKGKAPNTPSSRGRQPITSLSQAALNFEDEGGSEGEEPDVASNNSSQKRKPDQVQQEVDLREQPATKKAKKGDSF
jgi:hypothetical protein